MCKKFPGLRDLRREELFKQYTVSVFKSISKIRTFTLGGDHLVTVKRKMWQQHIATYVTHTDRGIQRFRNVHEEKDILLID